MITILYYGTIRSCTNCASETLDAATLGDAMVEVRKKYGKDALFAMKASMLTLDGARLESRKRSFPLHEGAELGVFPLCGGG